MAISRKMEWSRHTRKITTISIDIDRNIASNCDLDIVKKRRSALSSLPNYGVYLYKDDTVIGLAKSLGCHTYFHTLAIFSYNAPSGLGCKDGHISSHLHINVHSGQDQLLSNLLGESIVGEIFEGDLLIETLPIILLQMFYEIILYLEAIVKIIIYPDSNSMRNPERLNELISPGSVSYYISEDRNGNLVPSIGHLQY